MAVYFSTCDITGKRVLLNEGVLAVNRESGEWYFCAPEVEDQVQYKSEFPCKYKITNQVEMLHFLAYLAHKDWFEPTKFFTKIRQLMPVN